MLNFIKKFKIYLLILLILIVFSYLFIITSIENDRLQVLKSLLNVEQKLFIKKYIFPYKVISQQQELISKQLKTISELQKEKISEISEQQKLKKLIYELNLKLDSGFSYLELKEKEDGKKIKTIESIIKLSNNQILKKFQLTSGFYSGINNKFPGSGYIDFYEDNIIVLSSRGNLVFGKYLNNNINFKQINNNINEYIALKQFKKNKWFSLKDLLVFNDKIFISYTEEIKENCWNTSVIYGDINYENIKFSKLFSPTECIPTINDEGFNAHQSGGRIISLDINHIILSIGDYRNRALAQDNQSVNGKIIKLNIFNNDYEIISMGHRNPQGLYFDEENNFILETEHGPAGGDEINIIMINKVSGEKIPNYGWAISSTGEHYGKYENNKELYKKYPLYKSHSDYGFIEPLKSFVPSIGISEIVKIKESKYVASSLKDSSLYFFDLNSLRQLINLNRVEVFERIRDLRFKDNKLYLFMEDTASIGVIDFK